MSESLPPQGDGTVHAGYRFQMLSRRQFLAGAAGGMATAALGRVALPPLLRNNQPPAAIAAAVQPAPAPTVLVLAQEGPPYRLITPNVGNDGFFPTLSLSMTNPFQGGSIFVQATNALTGTAAVFGRNYLLVPTETGLGGFVPFGVLDPPGPTQVTTQLIDMQGQPQNYTSAITVRATQWTWDDIWLPPPPTPDPNATPSPDPPLENEGPRLAETYLGMSPRMWELPFIIPIPLGGENIRISGYFGEQRSFNGGPRQGHHGGTDIGAPFGTPIRSTNHGRVVMSELTLIRGELVAIDHGGGVFSSYGHMQQRLVQVGDVVSRGDVIGLCGSTGLSTGAHLHWELAVGGILVDGLRWLDGTQGF